MIAVTKSNCQHELEYFLAQGIVRCSRCDGSWKIEPELMKAIKKAAQEAMEKVIKEWPK